jgi:hypothetical protein
MAMQKRIPGVELSVAWLGCLLFGQQDHVCAPSYTCSGIDPKMNCRSRFSHEEVRSRGGAMMNVAPPETAFLDRSSPFLLSIDGTWENPEEDTKNIEWVREFWDAMEPYSSDRAYQNFSMLDDEEDAARTMYGQNYDRLVEVKEEYDPENVFQANANVKPSD